MKEALNRLCKFTQLFRNKDRYDCILVAAFILINSIVFFNACAHDPQIGYDATGHLKNIKVLSTGRLVTPDDSREFFSPPLPYVLPATVMAITGSDLFMAAKIAQLVQAILSVGVILFLLKTCEMICPHSSLKRSAILFLGVIPTYYKTFAMVRGEPYVAFFVVMMLYTLTRIILGKQFRVYDAVILGGAMGLCALSRQWGIFMFPAVFVVFIWQWIRNTGKRSDIIKVVCVVILLGSVISGWFYIRLHFLYGSPTAFNRKSVKEFSFANQPSSFYSEFSLGKVFTHPVRPKFPNQLFPIFYSDLWGDYWCFFTIYGIDTRKKAFVDGFFLNRQISKGVRPAWLTTNYTDGGSYLGRVNSVSLFVSLCILAGILFAVFKIIRPDLYGIFTKDQRLVTIFLLLSICLSLAGYLWFLIMYPNIGKGDTIKATYMLQIFPFAALLAGMFLEYIKKRSLMISRFISGGICITFLHNLGAMVTHYGLYKLA